MIQQESSSKAAPDATPQTRINRFEKGCILSILFLGLLQAFNFRFALGSDAMSYLDVGDFWIKGDLANAVNGYWNPVYPIVLATACKAVGNPLNEAIVAHVVNVALLALNLFIFSLLMREIRAFRGVRDNPENSASEDLFTILSYLLFLWTHLSLIHLVNVTPDLLVMTSVLCAAAALFRLLRVGSSKWAAAGLGAALAFGYLTKAIMFVAAPAFIFTAGLCARRLSAGIKNIVIAAAAFGTLSAPYILALSKQQGHFTYSESGKLAYSWMVNKTRAWFHWQGEEPGSGTPAHPTRQLLRNPDVFEYEGRPGTYPPWFDPSYWNKGLRPQINVRQQLKAINEGLRLYYAVAFEDPVSIVVLLLLAIGFSGRSGSSNLFQLRGWPILIPALAIPALYLLVYVLPRYIAPFVLLLYLVLLINCWEAVVRVLPPRAVALVIACGFVPLLVTLAGETIKMNLFKRAEMTEQRRVAVALRDLGLQFNDRIAVLGRACDANFARMAGLKIVAEGFRDADQIPLWALRPDLEGEAVRALEAVRPKAIVRDTPPQFQSKLDWKPIPNTHYAVLMPK